MKVPSLRVLEARSNISWRQLQHLSFPWSQLTVFDQDGLDFLQQSTNLTDLDVTLREAWRHADNSSNLLQFLSCTPLPHLRILDFGACYRTVDLIDDTPVIYDMIESRYLQLEEGDNPEDTQFGSMVDVTMSSSSSISRVERPSSCLERVRVPRWLFFEEDQRWNNICGAIKVQCGIVMQDAE
ncbi:hypothetical protein CPB85DRAFT_1255488 [Mucidula mucida]|nr:hypothetical protein CPB85DRAFT_1255488 [Mucidula mucida]